MKPRLPWPLDLAISLCAAVAAALLCAVGYGLLQTIT